MHVHLVNYEEPRFNGILSKFAYKMRDELDEWTYSHDHETVKIRPNKWSLAELNRELIRRDNIQGTLDHD